MGLGREKGKVLKTKSANFEKVWTRKFFPWWEVGKTKIKKSSPICPPNVFADKIEMLVLEFRRMSKDLHNHSARFWKSDFSKTENFPKLKKESQN